VYINGLDDKERQAFLKIKKVRDASKKLEALASEIYSFNTRAALIARRLNDRRSVKKQH
jgi:hypothetical protein